MRPTVKAHTDTENEKAFSMQIGLGTSWLMNVGIDYRLVDCTRPVLPPRRRPLTMYEEQIELVSTPSPTQPSGGKYAERATPLFPVQ